MAKKEKPGKKTPDAELEDIDVREVSVVDKPAIKRPFLIVKSQDGDLGVIRLEEQEMAKNTTTAVADQDTETMEDEASILDMLDTAGDEDQATEEPEEPSVIVVKSDVVEKATTIVEQLVDLIKSFKEVEKKDAVLSDDMQAAVCTLITGVTSITSKDLPTSVEKVETIAAAIPIANHALGNLMTTVNDLQKLDASVEELPAALVENITGVGADLLRMSKSAVPISEDKTQSLEPETQSLKVFVSDASSDDPEIIITTKAGAKMKRARLSAFEKAVQTLITLLNEIKGDVKRDETKKSNEEVQDMSTEANTEKTEKNEEQLAITEKWLADISKKIDDALAEMSELKKNLTERVEVLSKKLDEVEATPSGEGDGDPSPEPVEKKNSFWGGRFL